MASNDPADQEQKPKKELTRKIQLTRVNNSANGVENPIDPDAPREGRLASLKTRGLPATRGTPSKIAFKPKVVQRRKKDGQPESLLTTNDDQGEGPSDRNRRTDRGRGRGSGRGRIRTEAPLIASGPFAQGPADAPSHKSKGRPARPSNATGSASQPGSHKADARSEKPNARAKVRIDDDDEEANLDDAGHPMRNLNRMKNTSVWAPITTDRVERQSAQPQVAVTRAETKPTKLTSHMEGLNFVDVKTEPSESTLTSRLPTPEINENMSDVQVLDDEILLPTTKHGKKEPAVKKQANKKDQVKVMTIEEADEEDRLASDMDFLRSTFISAESPSLEVTEDQIYFIQLPEVLPFWKPGPDEDAEDGLMADEAPKTEIVEIDQKAEDQKARSVETKKEDDNLDPALKEESKADIEVKSEVPRKKKRKQKPVQFPPPEGLLGQLHVHRSGKISCTWGGIDMEVGRGSDCGFLQEIVAINAKTDKCAWVLGRVSTRLMLVPNLDDLLDKQL